MEFDLYVGGSGKKLTATQRDALKEFGINLDLGKGVTGPNKVLVNWAKKFIALVKKNLATQQINTASNVLSQSIQLAPINLQDAKYAIAIEAAHYWKFINYGVKGAVTQDKAPQSPFQYRNKPIPARAIQEWYSSKTSARYSPSPAQIVYKVASERGITPEQAARSLSYATRENIRRHGIRATYFFTNVLTDDVINMLVNEMSETIGKQISVASPR